MSAKRKIRKALQMPEQPNAVMVETGTKFEGQKVFILVPISLGIDPKELAMQFTKQLNGLVAMTKEPSNKDIIEMSARNIDTLWQSGLGVEN